jgi:NAD(P)H dehydrogenase (quinone)
MKFLFIICHGSDNNLTHTHKVASTGKEALESLGHEIQILDLIKAGFGANFSKNDFTDYDDSQPFNVSSYQQKGKIIQLIKDTQQQIEWADYLIIYGPIWFSRLPAIFYTFQERVFTFGWGYDYTKKIEDLPCYGKKVLVVTTTGRPYEVYNPDNGETSLEAMLYGITCVFLQSGLRSLKSIAIYNVNDRSGEEYFESQLSKFAEEIKNIEKREEIPYESEKFKGKSKIIIAQLQDIPLL